MSPVLALSHYPELRKIPIDFQVEKALVPLASWPKTKSVFNEREKRTYKVVISDNSLEPMEEILFHNLPFNSQVGILGHELAHVADYIQMSYSEIMSFAYAYLFQKFRSGIEKHTDVSTIEHGLGWQLLEYAEYVRNVPSNVEKGSDWMDKYYLDPQSIRRIMSELDYDYQ